MFTAHALDLRDASDAAAWDDLWRRSPWRTPFSERAFASALAGAFGLGLEAAGVREGERLVAGTLLFAKRRGPLRLAVVPPLAAYHGPLADPLPREADTLARRSALDALLAHVTLRFQACAFHPPPACVDARPFAWAGFACAPLYTYVSNLNQATNPGTWARGTRSRYNSHVAEYTVCTGSNEAGEAARLIVGSLARKARGFPLSRARLEALLLGLSAAGAVRVMTATRCGAREAAVVVPSAGSTGYLWLAGSVPGPAMTVLVGRLFEQLRGEGVEAFDFAGANTPSVAAFKQNFGGALVPYVRAVSVRARALRALHAVRPLV